jgi:hypothetical protein
MLFQLSALLSISIQSLIITLYQSGSFNRKSENDLVIAVRFAVGMWVITI